MKFSDCGLRFAAIAVVWTLAPTAAMAYIDPGAGAYMVQSLFAVVGAMLFYLRNPIRLARALWHWAFRSEKSREVPVGSVAEANSKNDDERLRSRGP